jgi:hypothetical protein
VLTGITRWRHTLDVKGADWQRLISYLTGLPAPESARPPLYSDGLVVMIAGEAKRSGPAVRPPEDATLQSQPELRNWTADVESRIHRLADAK